ncbi:hypothetical protein ALC57_04608, partial [Trachymyrmex cornetzi]
FKIPKDFLMKKISTDMSSIDITNFSSRPYSFQTHTMISWYISIVLGTDSND